MQSRESPRCVGEGSPGSPSQGRRTRWTSSLRQGTAVLIFAKCQPGPFCRLGQTQRKLRSFLCQKVTQTEHGAECHFRSPPSEPKAPSRLFKLAWCVRKARQVASKGQMTCLGGGDNLCPAETQTRALQGRGAVEVSLVSEPPGQHPR